MSWLSGIPLLGEVIGKLMDRISPDKTKIIDGQNRINEAEVSGGPPSRLRLWRGFLGWMLSIVFIWEVIGRTIIMTYWPDIKLPPSVLREVSQLLIGMLGLGL